MNWNDTLSLALDPARIFTAQKIQADPWQQELLRSTDRQILLNCSRQSGKSTTVSALALHQALFSPASLILLLSPSQRQSAEIFRKVLDGYNALHRPVPATYETQLKLELENGSRLVCLPGREETIRSYSGVQLLVIDEAARVPDDLYRSVRPMLAVSNGRLIALSTPFGQRGWFFQEWIRESAEWKKVKISWKNCPRIKPDFMEEELKSLGQHWVDQEYNCLFTALEGLVYPDFEKCIWDTWPPIVGRGVGGIDWGYRNPFAAIWGVLDHDDVLWIGSERYLRETSLHEHVAALPRQVHWYADPSGRTEIEECRTAGLKVWRARNEIRLGIQAVNARIQTGRLKVSRRCVNLIQEAQLYRYPNPSDRQVVGENPIDDHNHALGALRYLVSRLDARYIAKLRRKTAIDHEEGPLETDPIMVDHQETQKAIYQVRTWVDPKNESLWTPLN